MIESYEIKPYTQAGKIPANRINNLYPLEMVLPVVGMNEYFVKKILGRHECLTEDMVVELLEQDAFSETFVPRSMVLQYLRKKLLTSSQNTASLISELDRLYKGDAISLIDRLKDQSIQCVVTSTPYWAMRIYDEFFIREWADGETCAFGLEQTPEGFIRHSVETLYHLQRKLTPAGSLWWNIMDSYNTRTQRGGQLGRPYQIMHQKLSMRCRDMTKRHGKTININAIQLDILTYKMGSNALFRKE